MNKAAPAATYFCSRCDDEFPRDDFVIIKGYDAAKRAAPWRVAIVKHEHCRWESAVLQKVRERAKQRQAPKPLC